VRCRGFPTGRTGTATFPGSTSRTSRYGITVADQKRPVAGGKVYTGNAASKVVAAPMFTFMPVAVK
jgi:hypothetical protein